LCSTSARSLHSFPTRRSSDLVDPAEMVHDLGEVDVILAQLALSDVQCPLQHLLRLGIASEVLVYAPDGIQESRLEERLVLEGIGPVDSAGQEGIGPSRILGTLPGIARLEE